MSTDVLKPDWKPVDVEGALKALEEAVPTKHACRNEAFAKLLPKIEEALGKDVSQKHILALLAKFGLKLSPATFNKLLKEHRSERAQGDVQ